ncbi:hypothetical protein PanWU01x14_022070, partial [Parasponia andersonii]
MRCTRSWEHFPLDLEIERMLREIRRVKNRQANPPALMGDQDETKPLRDYAVPLMDGLSS